MRPVLGHHLLDEEIIPAGINHVPDVSEGLTIVGKSHGMNFDAKCGIRSQYGPATLSITHNSSPAGNGKFNTG
jgi:hypothetical protein